MLTNRLCKYGLGVANQDKNVGIQAMFVDPAIKFRTYIYPRTEN